MQLVMTQTNFERRRLEQARLAATTGVLLEEPIARPRASRIAKRSQRHRAAIAEGNGAGSASKFVRAGYHSTTPIAIYSLAQLVLPAMFALLPLLFLPMSQAMVLMHHHGVDGLSHPRRHPVADHAEAPEGHHQRSARISSTC